MILPMMRLLLSALALFAPAAAPASAQNPAGSVSDALIERFISVTPESRRLRSVDRTPDPGWLEVYSRLNPGREDEIRAILGEAQACFSEARNRALLDMMKDAARGLGEHRLNRLIELFTGPDFEQLKPIMLRLDNGDTLSPAESAELERLKQAYPIMDYYRALNRGEESLGIPPATVPCSRAAHEKFERNGIQIPRAPGAPPPKPD
jgi:hypothetical protein